MKCPSGSSDGQVAIGTCVLAPLGEVTVEIGFGGHFKEVAEAVFAVGLSFLECPAGFAFGLLEEPDPAGRKGWWMVG